MEISKTHDWQRKFIHRMAREGAKIKNLGKMCDSCAFKLDSPANLEDYTVEIALECVAYGMAKFNCHQEKGVDAGRPCVGFLYAQLYETSKLQPMKKGFWNYTEPVEYRAVMVKVLPMETPVLHWQNAFVGTERQAVEIVYRKHLKNGSDYTFLIDNEDGMGWEKLQKGGGPDSGSRHIDQFEFVRECTDEETITALDPEKMLQINEAFDKWAKERHPEEWQRLESLRKTILNARQFGK